MRAIGHRTGRVASPGNEELQGGRTGIEARRQHHSENSSMVKLLPMIFRPRFIALSQRDGRARGAPPAPMSDGEGVPGAYDRRKQAHARQRRRADALDGPM